MGTSQSNPGPNSKSPLVPPWAEEAPMSPKSPLEPTRFKPFRRALGSYVSTGDRDKLNRALGHYARTASGGSKAVVHRMGSVTRAGGGLFGALSGLPVDPGEKTIDINTLSGLPCEHAISAITQALATEDGDSEKIKVSMKQALIEALDGIETFDPQHITDTVIIDTMIAYLSESIFLQIINDGAKSWNKAETPRQLMDVEMELRELIKVIVDKNMAPKLKGNIRSFTRVQMIQIEQQTINNVWEEWETYQ